MPVKEQGFPFSLWKKKSIVHTLSLITHILLWVNRIWAHGVKTRISVRIYRTHLPALEVVLAQRVLKLNPQSFTKMTKRTARHKSKGLSQSDTQLDSGETQEQRTTFWGKTLSCSSSHSLHFYNLHEHLGIFKGRSKMKLTVCMNFLIPETYKFWHCLISSKWIYISTPYGEITQWHEGWP